MTTGINLTDITLNLAGLNNRHDKTFKIDRPNGAKDYLFVYFTTDIYIRDSKGERNCPAGTTLLHTPGFPQYYYGPERGFANHWIHFQGSALPALIKRFAIPVNVAVQPKPVRSIISIMHNIVKEQFRRNIHWEDQCSSLLRQLLISFSRGCVSSQPDQSNRRPLGHAEALRAVREMIYKRIEYDWSVPEMSKLVHLSPSRFAHLYRELFDKSPMEDLIDARVQRACWLLSFGNISVKETALKAGFIDSHYFSRCFRNRMGCAPSNYARGQA